METWHVGRFRVVDRERHGRHEGDETDRGKRERTGEERPDESPAQIGERENERRDDREEQ